MPPETCPNCGAEVPWETGQHHAITASAGIVQCPRCGAQVTLEKPGSAPPQAPSGDVPRAAESVGGEASGEDSFSGEETVEGVMDEVREKEGG